MIDIKGEIHSSKNSKRIFTNRRTGKPFITKSAASKRDETEIVAQLLEQLHVWRAATSGLPHPMCVGFAFRRKTKARFDYINIAQGICDAMVEANYLPDDSAEYLIPVFMPYVVDKHNPGCTLTIISV